MIKYLLPKEGKFYKANMHMHTTISDGKMTANETKEEYVKRGYSIVAFTDHEVMVPHNDLTDDNFLAITSTEILINEKIASDASLKKTYHLNLYSFDSDKHIFNTFNENVIWKKHSLDYIDDAQKQVKYAREYCVDSINDIVKKANEEKCLVSYNHPTWSLQNYTDYIGLKGLWGVEWYNNTCERMGYTDTMKPIDDLLRIGERVFPLATDDAHSFDDCFGGFIMIKAPELEYSTIFHALEKGDFYSSTNPEIDELIYEDGIVKIKTSPVCKIFLTTDRRITKFVVSDDQLLTEASFDISPFLKICENEGSKNQYFRLTIVDENGKIAHTRAYFIDEIL